MTAAQKKQSTAQSPATLSVHATIVRFSAQAVWLDSDLEMKTHLTHMCDSVAAHFGKSRLDFSLNDLHSLASSINKLAKSSRIANIQIADALGFIDKAQTFKKSADSVAYIYRFAKLAIAGDAFPLASKFMLSIAAPRIKRASITYAAGIMAAELYKTSSDCSIKELDAEPIHESTFEDFDPIFTHFSREHLASLCALLKIGADINSTDSELKQTIVNEFSYYTKNFFKHIYHKVAKEKSQYRQVLDTVCADLDIQIIDDLATQDLEKKIVARVLQETIDKLEGAEKEQLIARLSSVSGIDFDYGKAAASGSIAALIVGNYAGFGTYLAASSALGALTSGLGITASFGVYTTMSSAISIALGPIGFGAATAAFIATMTKSSPRKAIPAIIYIATMRAKLNTAINPVATKERRYKYILVIGITLICLLVGLFLGKFL
jgi:uncharacterized protein YaaW (UPF0174 family)